MLFQPGWTLATRHFQLDVELLQCLFQLLLVPRVVRRYGVVEQDELVVQHLHLRGGKKWREKEMSALEVKRLRFPGEDEGQPSAHLVLLQEPQLDRDVVSHPLVLVAVDLELLLGLLHLGSGGGIARPQIQLLQVGTVRVILNPGSCVFTRSLLL